MAPRSRTSAKRSSADAEAPLVETLFNATRTLRHRLRPALEREGLTAPMFWTLHQLAEEGPMNVGQLADACVVSPANVSSAVEQLEEAGLVLRHAGPRDRRVVVLTCTARGRSVHRAVWTRVGRLLVGSLSGIAIPDLDAASRVLGRLASASEAAPMAAGGAEP
jgi:MarR family transcriptional regulator, organic hydroperoxide resistance regulator